MKQSLEWLDELFASDIGELERLGLSQPRTNYAVLQMSVILRKLLADEQPLIQHAAARCETPVIFLLPEPISGHPRYNPEKSFPVSILKYAPEISERTHPGGTKGYFYCPYLLDEYLTSPHVVLDGRAVAPREMILFFANKMGGIHADKNLIDISDGGRSVDAETLYKINERFSIYGEKALFNQFGIIAERVWRALAPLRDELVTRKK